MSRLEAMKSARERAKKYKFGEQITNVCAGEGNPRWHSIYVSHGKNTVKCTDGNGEFWETGIEVVFPGWISRGECEELFRPIWKEIYGG